MTKTYTMPDKPLLNRAQIAKRCAADLEADWVVNLGIGMPTMTLPHVPKERDVIMHSENGIIGMGPPPEREEDIDGDLMSAGKGPVTLMDGGVFVHTTRIPSPWRAAAGSTAPCSGPIKSRRTAIWQIGRSKAPAPAISAAPWTSRSAPSRSSRS